MEKELLLDLIEQGMTQREISEEIGKSQTTVTYWLKKHNLSTKHNKQPREKKHRCYKCGDEDPENFYGDDKVVCKTCHNDRVSKAGRDKRAYAIEKLGGKCVACGFDKYQCSLDIHHLDPKKKDPNFNSLRGWSLNRIDNEIKHCTILCKNCHAAHHNGLI